MKKYIFFWIVTACIISFNLPFSANIVWADEDEPTILAHKIIQTPNIIEIRECDPIIYYPGALMGFVNTRINNVETIFREEIDGFDIGFGRVDHKNKKEYVLVAISGGNGYTIGVSTILVIGSDESYTYAETDIGFIDRTGMKAVNTQELVYQKFKQSWSKHYNNLRKIIHRLVQKYSSSHSPELKQVAGIYLKLDHLLTMLTKIVKNELSSYDKMIDKPYAIIFNKVGKTYSLDQKFLSARAYGDGPAGVYIYGDAIADIIPHKVDGIDFVYLVRFDGTMNNYGISGSATVMFSYEIGSYTYELVWGVGSAWKTSGGVGYKYVMFSMSGYAGWNLVVNTLFHEWEYDDFPRFWVTIIAETPWDSDLDQAELDLSS